MKQDLNKYILGDLYDLCYRAHQGTSFSPERRAIDYVKSYSKVLEEDLKLLGEKQGNYKAKFIEKFSKWMSAKSRCISSMITGPSNFPVRRAQKYSNWADGAYNDFEKWRTKYFKAVNRVPTKSPEDELEIAEKRLEELKIDQIEYKEINKAARKSKIDNIPELTKYLLELGFQEKHLLKLGGHWKELKIPSFVLTNNNATIKRTEEKVKIMQSRIERKSTWEDIEFEGGYVTIEDDRVKIFHDEKPKKEIIKELKSKGFRWSPNWRCWTRKHTENAIYTVNRLLSFTKKTKSEKKMINDRISIQEQLNNTIFVKKLIPNHQQQLLIEQNKQELDDVILRLEKELESIPKKDKGKNMIVHAHYFHGGSHWYILDINDKKNEFFAYVILNGDYQNAGLGIVSIDELVKHENVELDFYFKVDKLENILRKKHPELYSIIPKTKSKSKKNVKKVEKNVDIKTVDHYSEEYKLIRRFFNMLKKPENISFRKVQLLYNAFQKAALHRKVRKTSLDADLFTKVNKKIIALFEVIKPELKNPSKNNVTITEFKDKKLYHDIEKYVGSQKINTAIGLLNSFILMQGYKPDVEKATRLLKRIENAIAKDRVEKGNRLYDEIVNAKKALTKYIEKPSVKIEPELVGLSLPKRSMCTNRVKCEGINKNGQLKKGYKFIPGGKIQQVCKKKKVV
ncbi:hypothetical protein [Kordia sp.]|uniref:hypothetical protein n=1 Tax=Kordia sp. TaxID=1965332 RepID=UPI0025BAC0F7|nr:hypothetical protein [Kordia sp.]MCH2194733.1 hypothetical protein [Kordia sp.]